MGTDLLCGHGGLGWCARRGALVALVSLISWGPLAAPAAAVPSNNTPPSISGTPQRGQSLTEMPGSWGDAAAGVTVQWEDCPDSSGSGCTPIPNSPKTQGSHYTPTTNDTGQWITVVESAFDGRGNVSTATANPVGPVTLGAVTATMQWTFYYTPAYTKVLGLTVNGLSPGMTVVTACHGHGCPFSRRSSAVTASHACGQQQSSQCKPPGTLDLTSPFHRRRLVVGARITVDITVPGGIGKDYRFTVRARRGPRVDIACLAPGATSPSGGC